MMLRLLAISAVTASLYTGGAFAQSASHCAHDSSTCSAARSDATAESTGLKDSAKKAAGAQSDQSGRGVDERLVKRVKSDASSRATGGKPPRTVADKSKPKQDGKTGAKKRKHKHTSAKSSASRAKPHDTVTREPKRKQR